MCRRRKGNPYGNVSYNDNPLNNKRIYIYIYLQVFIYSARCQCVYRGEARYRIREVVGTKCHVTRISSHVRENYYVL